jgi:cephalosporin-C deacetylase-like acetyl esterase
MDILSRRDFVRLGLAAPIGQAELQSGAAAKKEVDIHRYLLDVAARYETERRARFAAIKSQAELEDLQASLRATFLRLLDGLPSSRGVPPVKQTGVIESDDYRIRKLVYESFPGYFVPALMYEPKAIAAPRPAVLSPCGHSTNGKAAAAYQIFHINLAKRGYVVLTYDPVGQGERSQFWDIVRKRSRFDLGCGEHAVIGNLLYLLGTSLARFRIWDGIRGLDYLASLPYVDKAKLGCAGNSGGGTLTAYISALDQRVSVAAISCYITTLRRRMGNRIQEDPPSDPEQDIFGFVSAGIDHAGLLALLAPRPVLVCAARQDFFPIEGTRETFSEAKHLFEIAGAGERVEIVEANLRHGLTPPLRSAVYRWFDRWLAGKPTNATSKEFPVVPRADHELLVCPERQVNISFRSRQLLPFALGEFDRRSRPKHRFESESFRKDVLSADNDQPGPVITDIVPATVSGRPIVLCVNGNETGDWREEKPFLQHLGRQGYAIAVVDPRGVGSGRVKLQVVGHDYSDAISGVEENVAYNAFLVGKSLLAMRTCDILAALKTIRITARQRRFVVCGRKDAALAACLAALVDPGIGCLALEEMLLSFRAMFNDTARAINAASILPGLLQRFTDVADILAALGARKVLIAAGAGPGAPGSSPNLTVVDRKYSREPALFSEWLAD